MQVVHAKMVHLAYFADHFPTLEHMANKRGYVISREFPHLMLNPEGEQIDESNLQNEGFLAL